eukprot:TRINITY_DN65061_c0_g1_i1.p1 TRINITY_DN65061_c0_g1~~TRINITY_DN65061_c0_g1_i1.p1  ORF type:complete len:450 (+),score=57.78 TRINITY_DN65061_c0_g1_i1:99-1448(+)
METECLCESPLSDPTVLELRDELKRTQRLLERLERKYAELADGGEALRKCLTNDGTVNLETFLAMLHRERFARACADSPCSWGASLDHCVASRDLMLNVASYVGYSGVQSMSLGSVPLRGYVSAISLELMDLFPPLAYIVGGVDDNDEPLSTADSYDLTSGTWKPIATLNIERFGCTATTIAGCVIAAGGWNSTGLTLQSAESFDPQRGRWSILPLLRHSRAEAASASYENQVLLVGGCCQSESRLDMVIEAEAWTLGHNRWTALPSPRVCRRGAALVTLGSSMYLLGGWDASYVASDSVERFDFHTGAWYPAPSMQQARGGVAAAALLGHLYAVGGYAHHCGDIATVERYDQCSQCWELLPSIGVPRRMACAVPCGTQLLVLGGMIGQDSDETLEVGNIMQFDPRSGDWTFAVGGDFPAPRRRFGAAACVLMDDGCGRGRQDAVCTVS